MPESVDSPAPVSATISRARSTSNARPSPASTRPRLCGLRKVSQWLGERMLAEPGLRGLHRRCSHAAPAPGVAFVQYRTADARQARGMDSADHMRESIELALAAIRGADPARYADPTPCTDFAARDVVNHLAFGFLLAHRSATREPWDPAWTASDRTPFLVGRSEPEWAKACAEQADVTARAWAEPGAWEGES